MISFKDSNDTLLAIWKKSDEWEKGLSFLTSETDFIQVGTWWYEEGKILDRHHHNVVERSADLTQECVVIMCGSMNVKLYDFENEYVTEFTMQEGDFAVFLRGGHEYEILQDDTKIVEVKNGPFLGVDIDKTRF